MRGRSNLQLSPDARVDLEDILLESAERWGMEHSIRYEARLDRVLGSLASFPELGARRDEVRPGLRVLPVAHHLILYELRNGRVWVLRILHERADPEHELPG